MPSFAFMPFIKKIVAKYGKKEASVVGTVVTLLGAEFLLFFPSIPYESEVLGIKTSLLVYLVGLVIYGIGMGVYMCVNWAMMSDAIDYNEWKFGKRDEGTVYAIHSFFRKLAQGVGPAAVVFIMGRYLGYEVSKGTVAQSMETTVNMCWLVGCLYGISAIIQFFGLAVVYNIDKKTLEQMQSDLAERHAKQY
jgi:GPH family glycoside/pentoside/hexuronide:cation symporter